MPRTHTPGPWVAEPDLYGNGGIAIRPADKAKYSSWDLAYIKGTPTELDKANARLIACAPELLETLKMVLENDNRFCSSESQLSVTQVNQIMQAIAKAEGRDNV